MSGKPLRCRLGMHSWYFDCGIVLSVRRCNLCGRADDPARAAALDAERARVAQLPHDAGMGAFFAAALGWDGPE